MLRRLWTAQHLSGARVIFRRDVLTPAGLVALHVTKLEGALREVYEARFLIACGIALLLRALYNGLTGFPRRYHVYR